MKLILSHIRRPDFVGCLPDYLVMISAILLMSDSMIVTDYACFFSKIMFCVGMFQFVMLWVDGMEKSIGRYVNLAAALSLWIVPIVVARHNWIDILIHGVLSGWLTQHLTSEWGHDA